MTHRTASARLLGVSVVTVALAVTSCSDISVPRPAVSTTRPAPAASTPAAEPTPAPTSSATSAPERPSAAQLRSLVSSRISTIIKSEPAGGVSVAALNLATGARFAAGAQSGMWTASTYKLLVLIALMRRDGGLDGYDGTAAQAIENSDNAAGYSLFLGAGGNPGVQSALDAIGASHTVPGVSDPTFTRTSAMDYLKVLEAVAKPGVLTTSERSYVLGLMRQVEADQRWGVGVVADKGTDFANKNGWLSIDDSNGPGETDNGLWAVNSVGIVTVHHQPVLMAIFTEHQPSMGVGVALVQKLARTMIPALSRS